MVAGRELIDACERSVERELIRAHALVPLPDNQYALSGGYDHTVKLSTSTTAPSCAPSRAPHTSCAAWKLLPDGRRFVSGSEDGTARIVEHGLVTQ